MGMHRRDFLVGSALGTLSGLAGTSAYAASSSSDVVEWQATELATAIRSRKVSCAEVMQAHLDRIARVTGNVNAIVALRDPKALI